jgi:hypothetical protein
MSMRATTTLGRQAGDLQAQHLVEDNLFLKDGFQAGDELRFEFAD